MCATRKKIPKINLAYKIARLNFVEKNGFIISAYNSRSEKVSSYIPSSIAEAISMQHYKTASFSNISVADLLAARHDLAIIEKVKLVAVVVGVVNTRIDGKFMLFISTNRVISG